MARPLIRSGGPGHRVALSCFSRLLYVYALILLSAPEVHGARSF